jgi:hypothetical protein
MPKISKRAIKAIRPDRGGLDTFIWDSGAYGLEGFGVRMKPSGVASYIVRYRIRKNRTKFLVIGNVRRLNPEEARTEARKLLAAAKGARPTPKRYAARASMTVAELCDLYLTKCEGLIKVSTLGVYRSRIERHIKPLLGDRSIRSLIPEDIERMQQDIASGKTTQNRTGPGGALTTGGKRIAEVTVSTLRTILSSWPGAGV